MSRELRKLINQRNTVKSSVGIIIKYVEKFDHRSQSIKNIQTHSDRLLQLIQSFNDVQLNIIDLDEGHLDEEDRLKFEDDTCTLKETMDDLRGTSLLRSTNKQLCVSSPSTLPSPFTMTSPTTLLSRPPFTSAYIVSEQSQNENSNQIELFVDEINVIDPLTNNKCPLCSAGYFPTAEGAHKCIKCGIPVHALSLCSGHKPNEDDMRICKSCLGIKKSHLSEETIAHENWNRKSRRQLKNSYLKPNPLLRHVNINNLRSITALPILKNGSQAEKLKSSTVKEIGKVILSNSCAFDTLASVFMVSYCDSEDYKKNLDQLNIKSLFFKFIKNGITYSERANIIVNELKPVLQQLEYNTTLAICEMTAGLVIQNMCNETPTLIEKITCSNFECTRIITNRPIVFLTFQTYDGSLNELQHFLQQRLRTEKSVCGYVTSNSSPCTGYKTTKPIMSPIHILIEVLYWNSEYLV